MKIKLTKSAIDRIAAPAKGRLTVHDTATNGLCVRITENDSRTFYLCRWRAGKVLWSRLGAVADLTIEQAQRMARDINANPDVNPNSQKRAAREAATLGDVWAAYRVAVSKAARTMQEDEGVWRRYLEPWADKRIKDVTEEAAQKLYNRIAAGEMARESMDRHGHTRPIKGGTTAARHAIKLLAAMFSACAKTFGLPGLNPAKEVRKAKEVACERYITADEFPAFWTAMEGQGELIRDMLKLALFTAQRRETLLSMRWDEINLPFAVWSIPADKMKASKAHVVPLTPEAMAILERRRASSRGNEWVFENEESSTGHLRNPEKAIERIWKAAAIPPFSLHDLRRTTATWMNSTGASEATIAAVLAHRYRNVTGIYAKATADTMRTALANAVKAIGEAAERNTQGEPATNAA